MSLQKERGGASMTPPDATSNWRTPKRRTRLLAGFFVQCPTRLRAGSRKRVWQLRDDNASRCRGNKHQLASGSTVRRLDWSNDRIANRNRRYALIAVRIEDIDLRLRRCRKQEAGKQWERVRPGVERMEVQTRVVRGRAQYTLEP